MRKSALFFFGLVVTIIVAMGLVILSSASEANGLRIHNDAYFFMKRQFFYLAIGIVVAVIAASIDYRIWRNHPSLAVLFYLAILGLLIAVFGFKAINGSHRWISLGPVRLQPSEFAKLAIVILIAVWVDAIGWRVEMFLKGAVVPAIFIGIIATPILFEPDFGSTMVVGLAGFLVMFVAGVKISHLIPFFIGGLSVITVLVLNNANRVARLFDDNKLYQVKMALAAIGNGGLSGVGLGQSMQKHYYLPEAHTDFIFAIGAEELGIGFSIAVLVLFLLFFALSIYIAHKAADRFGRYLVVGMAFIIFFQAMFNIGVVCKALPTKGMALPFFSYGGTNLVSAFFIVGTILSVGIHSSRKWKK